jgi:hypothetical protein
VPRVFPQRRKSRTDAAAEMRTPFSQLAGKQLHLKWISVIPNSQLSQRQYIKNRMGPCPEFQFIILKVLTEAAGGDRWGRHRDSRQDICALTRSAAAVLPSPKEIHPRCLAILKQKWNNALETRDTDDKNSFCRTHAGRTQAIGECGCPLAPRQK